MARLHYRRYLRPLKRFRRVMRHSGTLSAIGFGMLLGDYISHKRNQADKSGEAASKGEGGNPQD